MISDNLNLRSYRKKQSVITFPQDCVYIIIKQVSKSRNFMTSFCLLMLSYGLFSKISNKGDQVYWSMGIFNKESKNVQIIKP